MRSGPNTRRPMRRGGGGNNNGNNGRRGGSPRTQNFESNGPDVKVRGNAQQIVDKYQALAREAATAGNPVMAENYYQHAEHYHRVLTAAGGGDNRQNNRQQEADGGRNNNQNSQNNRQQANGQASRQPGAEDTAVSAQPVPETTAATGGAGVEQPEVTSDSSVTADITSPAALAEAVGSAENGNGAEKPKRSPRKRGPRSAKPAENSGEPGEASAAPEEAAAPLAKPVTEDSDKVIKAAS